MIVKIPEDIRIYENKSFGNFTTRQIVCLLIGGGVITPLFILLYLITMDITCSGILSALAGFPIMACGFIKKDGIFLEKQIKAKWDKTHLYKTKRPFIMRNLYEDIEKISKEDFLTNDEISKTKETSCKRKTSTAPLEKKKHGTR